MVLVLLVACPALVGTGLLLGGARTNRWAAPTAIVSAVLVLVLAVVAAVSEPVVRAGTGAITARLAVDALSAVAIVTAAAVFLAVIVFAASDIGSEEARSRFFGMMLVFVAAMFVTVTATNVFSLLAAWEIMGATSYALIGYWWHDGYRVRSATVAFITTRSADLGMYFAAGAVLAAGDAGLDLSSLGAMDSGWRDAALGGLALAALGKSAQLPFSFWLSHAMAGPSPVSALLHSATMVAAGGYLLLRIGPGIQATGWLGPAVAWVGVLTALAMGAVAVAQRDLKQLLAASTCSQIGFIVTAAGVGAVSGGAAQFVAHAAVKSLLFLVAGAWLTAVGTKDLTRLRGVAGAHPVAGIAFTAGALTLAGVPPFSIWVAKDDILSSALGSSVLLYLVGLAAAVVGAAYAAKALVVVWAAPGASESVEERPRSATIPMAELLSLPALAIAAGGLGAVRIPLGPGRSGPAVWELAVSGTLAVGVVLVVGWLQLRLLSRGAGLIAGPGWLRRWLYLDEAASVVVTRPIMRFARTCARFDNRVIARGVEAAATGTVRLSIRVGTGLEPVVSGAVRAIARVAGRLGSLARRPQTGMLHAYYAQSIVATVVIVVVLILVR